MGQRDDYKSCHAWHFWAQINANAQMAPCCDYRPKESEFGSLREKSFKEIWESEDRFRKCAKIDPSKCMPRCKFNEYNILLDQLSRPIKDEHHL